MLRKYFVLCDPNPPNPSGAGGGAPPPPTPTPASTPPPASSTPPPASSSPPPAPAPTPPPAEPENDDPFVTKKPAAAATPPPAAKPAATPPAPPVEYDKLGHKELREHTKRLKAEKDELDGKIKAHEEKIAALERKGIDTTALTGRLAELEKERDQARADLRAYKQEASPEFIEKYDKPFNNLAKRTSEQIQQLNMTDADGQVRKAIWADFTKLYSLPIGEAIEQATAMFGSAANFVIQKLEILHDMDATRATALEEERAQFKQRTDKEIADANKQRGDIATMWESTNERLAKSNPDYRNDPEDKELNDARKAALEVFDASITTTDKAEFIRQKVLKDAHVKQKVGAWAVQKIVIERQKTEIEALKKQIEELKGTAPGGQHRPGGDDGGGGAPEDESSESWGRGLVQAVK